MHIREWLLMRGRTEQNTIEWHTKRMGQFPGHEDYHLRAIEHARQRRHAFVLAVEALDNGDATV